MPLSPPTGDRVAVALPFPVSMGSRFPTGAARLRLLVLRLQQRPLLPPSLGPASGDLAA